MTDTFLQPVKIGVVGLGHFGRQHAQTLQGLAEAELVALVDADLRQCEAAKRWAAYTPVWNNPDQALKESHAEAWVVATSTSAHVSIARTLLAAGKAVLLEKPIAQTLDEALLLEPLVKADSSNLMMGHIMLFNSEVQQLLHEKSNRGEPIFVDAVRHRTENRIQLFPGDPPHRLLMVHDLYVVQALFERKEPQRAFAYFHRTNQGAIDCVTALLEWPDSGVARLTASFLAPSGMGEEGFDRMELFGRGWAARIHTNPRPMEVWDDRLRLPLTLEIGGNTCAPSGMLAEELRCFCRVARGVEAVPVGATYQDALQIEKWLREIENQSTKS